MVDLLNYCMYADNLVFLAEDRLIADTVARFNWDPKIPFDQFDAKSINNARTARESQVYRDQAGHIEEAEGYYRKAIEANPRKAWLLGSFAHFLHTYRLDFDQAEQFYKRSLESDPHSAPKLGDYGQFLASLGRFNEAETYLLSALERLP